MKRTTRHFGVGIMAALSIVALSACGANSTSQTTSTTDSSGPVQLTLWTGFTGGDRAAYEDLVATFNETHPHIQVTMEIQPWDTISQKLPSAWATGQAPDIATPNFDPNVLAQYVETNAILPLDNVGDSEGQINAEKLAPAAVEAFTYDNQLYAVPANIATLQLYYNKDLFAAKGVANPPATVDELRETAKKLSGDGVYGLSVGERETIQMWPVLQWLDGSDIVDAENCSMLDTPEAIESLSTWSKLAVDGVLPVGLTGAESDSLFSAGKAAMQINGPWAAASYTEAGINLGIAQVPEGVDGKATLASTVPFAISAATKHPAEAQEFLAWWTSQDAQRQLALASGFPPVRTDMADDSELAANEVVKTFAEGLPFARLYLPGVPEASKVDSEVYVPLIAEITRGADVTTAVKTASENLNSLTGCAK